MAGVIVTDALTDHIAACGYCNGRNQKYCQTGRALWIEAKAQWIASLPDSDQRRAEFWRIAADNPEYQAAIKRRAAELFRGQNGNAD